MNIVRVQCQSSDEFLDYLRLGREIWRNAHFGDLVFRGQRCSEWALVPSAFRQHAILGYRTEVTEAPCKDIESQSRGEYGVVLEFLMLADSVGLPVPGDSQIFRNVEDQRGVIENSFWQGTWPTPEVLETLAIAQHHGVPTRLLDFSYNPQVAAYFAALDAMKWLDMNEQVSENSAFAIWVVDLRFIRRAWHQPPAGSDRVCEITVPRAKNPFLHAQHGLFLLDTGVSNVWNQGQFPALEQVICERPDYWKAMSGFWTDSAPQEKLLSPIIKLEAPLTCVEAVIRFLHSQGTTYAHVMPSYDGVVQSLKMMSTLGL